MDEPARRVWNRPQLIVIARSGHEAAVLVVCKDGAGSSSGQGIARTSMRLSAERPTQGAPKGVARSLRSGRKVP